jgi:hypothetical protein
MLYIYSLYHFSISRIHKWSLFLHHILSTMSSFPVISEKTDMADEMLVSVDIDNIT